MEIIVVFGSEPLFARRALYSFSFRVHVHGALLTPTTCPYSTDPPTTVPGGWDHTAMPSIYDQFSDSISTPFENSATAAGRWLVVGSW